MPNATRTTACPIFIGWRDPGVRPDQPYPPAILLRTEAARKAIAHLRIERGARHAWARAWQLVRHLTRIARQLPEGSLQIHTTNQVTAPDPLWDRHYGLGVEVRYIVAGRLQWSINLYSGWDGSGIVYSYARRDGWRFADRADALVRKLHRDHPRVP